MNKIVNSLLLIPCIIFLTCLVYAQDIEVRKSTFQKIDIKINPVNANNYNNSHAFLKVLKDDLSRSGWFNFDDKFNSYSIHINLIIKNKLQVEVYIKEGQQKEFIYSFAYASALENYRGLAHQTADRIILCITGKRGISTSKLHARGPVGVSQLTSFKYKVRGNGQIRP